MNITSIFPFLYLPAEIRNIIYGLCFDFDGIEVFFDSYFRKLSKSVKLKCNSKHPMPRMHTPTVFLINRQIFQEATALVRKGTVRFRHGLLRVQDITSVVSGKILKQVSCIEISDDGHSILKKATLSDSWHGYIRLITSLASTLADGHQLQRLVVRLTDPKLLIHMTFCFQHHHNCGYRDQLKQALNTLQLVRGIREVVFVGFHHGFSAGIKSVMESKQAITLSRLPAEIREMIWSYAVDWPDISKIYARVIAESISKGPIMLYPRLKTPTALLLNRQYYAEARAVLLRKAFKITFPIFDVRYPYSYSLHLFQYVSRSTLQGARHLKIKVSDQHLFNYFKYTVCEAIAESDKLRMLSLDLMDTDKAKLMRRGRRPYPDSRLHSHLMPLFNMRGLAKAEVTGDLPNVYADPLIAILESTPSMCEILPEPKGIQYGSVVDLEPVKRLTVADFR